MKFKALIIPLAVITLLSVGCGRTNNTNESNPDSNKTETDKNGGNVDTVTAPSRVTDEAKLLKAVNESWIVILENDVATSKDIVLESGFQKTDKDNKKVDTSRVVALYKSNDSNEKIADYTLTVPKLTIKDENAKVEGGTIKGDVYIEAKNVKLEGTTIDGNVYFNNEEEQSTFHMDEASKVTGVMEIK
ncbi:hypothetical protein R0131_02135 [Clostridium sp. AL.422]|uniref:hypothetical protein n=1 Tax=Clostridium TaxID=1485 RepID=UPI00293DE8CC|nr:MULTISPECIES: hypothetical protein [unclassified Clostridium]MDV4149624.1 hypothetical protein [Clostridium sp. AL.422]